MKNDPLGVEFWPIRTKVNGDIMTYGWLDRLLVKLVEKLHGWHERRTSRFWEQDRNKVA